MKASFDVSTLPVLTFRFIGTKSRIIQHPQKDEFTNFRICSTFVNNLIEGKKQVRMTNLSMNSREIIHRHFLKPPQYKPDKAYLLFVLSDLRLRGFRTGNFD